MANLGQLVSTTLFEQNKLIADEVMYHHPVTAVANRKMITGGYEYRRLVAFNTTFTGGAYSGGEELNVPEVEDFEVFQFPVRSIYEAFAITGRDWRANSGKHAIIDLVDEKIQVLMSRLKNLLSTMACGDGTTYGGKAFYGIRLFQSTTPSTGTYAGIDRSVASNAWARNLATNITLTAANIQSQCSTAITQICRGTEAPDIAFAGRTAWQLLHDSLITIQRINDPQAKGNMTAGGRKLIFDGCTFYHDGGYGGEQMGAASTNTVRIMYSKYLNVTLDTQTNFKPLNADQEKGLERFQKQDMFFTIISAEGNIDYTAPALSIVLYP